MLTARPALIFLMALSLASFSIAAGQQRRDPDQDDVIRLKSDLVTVTASVTDTSGRALKSLRATDFVIYEDGVRQKIEHFAATEEPFSLMLLLDISGSTAEDISLIKRAAREFIDQLRDRDRVGVIVFSRDVEVIAEFTDSRPRVEAAIESLYSAQGNLTHRYTSKTGTSFYDALYLAAEESPLRRAEGRKAIVCMSDGVDSTSKMKYDEVVGLVERAEATLYFLQLNTEEVTRAGLVKPRTDPGFINLSQSQVDRYFDTYDPNSPDRQKPRATFTADELTGMNRGLYELARRDMRQTAERTGGRVYPVRSLSDLSGVYKQIADDLRTQYSIGYYPANAERDGRWREIRVEVLPKGATVRARSGYWAK
ncbi:MAG TPA: VWA domain-containing protein [Blastocatellia bacterium]